MPLLNRPAHSKATLGDRTFSFVSSTVWNSIPNDVRCASSLSSSMSRLKTYLFCSTYKDRTLSLITVYMCMVWSLYSFVVGLSKNALMCILKFLYIVKLINHDCLPITMVFYIMLYIMLAYVMLFAALSNAVCIMLLFFPFLYMLCLGLLTHSLFISCIKLHLAQCF